MKSRAENAARTLVALLEARSMTCSVAESCTGGGVASAITDVPGASGVFPGGAVVYANSAKESLLGVSPATLEMYGAVSSECAAEMAQGARAAFSSDIAVSVTGIAGPGGGTPEKPVGTVWFAISSFSGVRTEKAVFAGDRALVRAQAVVHALGMLTVAAAGS